MKSIEQAARLVRDGVSIYLAPEGTRRISANPHANGGVLRESLDMPDIRAYAFEVEKPGAVYQSPTAVLATFLRDVIRRNMKTFRLFGPDETASNKLDGVYEASGKRWLAETKPEDADGGALTPDGRVMEMLSEHTLEGWFEGYVLTGRHGLLATYEAFVHVIDDYPHHDWFYLTAPSSQSRPGRQMTSRCLCAAGC